MNVITLTGNETRHKYFKVKLSLSENINVIKTYAESNESSLLNRVVNNKSSSNLERHHVVARDQSELDYFQDYLKCNQDLSKTTLIPKGHINEYRIVENIIKLNPDFIVCYGSSIIKSELITHFANRFINVHLGISPYYRGSGTNVWPIINSEFDLIGATYMFLNKGIDTGNIIHQIRAKIFLGDSPHSIGNRLIKKMTDVYIELLNKFQHLDVLDQPLFSGKLYLRKDFNNVACELLYKNCETRNLSKFLSKDESSYKSILIQPLLA